MGGVCSEKGEIVQSWQCKTKNISVSNESTKRKIKKREHSAPFEKKFQTNICGKPKYIGSTFLYF